MTNDLDVSPLAQVQKKLRRIRVETVTALPESGSLALATQMAAPIGARLVGHFVEDQALIDLAHLPFASEVSFSGTVRPLERERLLRQWQGQAVQAEKAFATAARSAGLEWSFDVRRGKPLFAMLECAERDDIVVLHTTGRLTSISDVARVARAATTEIHADVLLSGGAGQRTIVNADATLVVLDDMTSRGEACCHAAEILADRAGMICASVPCRGADLLALGEQVRQLHPALIVADGGSPLFSKDGDVTVFSRAAGCAVLIFGSKSL